MPSITEHIQQLLQPIIESRSLFLVEIVLRGERSSKVVEIYLDSDTGITLEECSEVSRELSALLDETEVIDGRYRLDVSSPGVDKPLKLPRQYRKNIGRICSVRYRKDGAASAVEGKLKEVTGTGITVMKGKTPVDILFTEIIDTVIIPQFT